MGYSYILVDKLPKDGYKLLGGGFIASHIKHNIAEMGGQTSVIFVSENTLYASTDDGKYVKVSVI